MLARWSAEEWTAWGGQANDILNFRAHFLVKSSRLLPTTLHSAVAELVYRMTTVSTRIPQTYNKSYERDYCIQILCLIHNKFFTKTKHTYIYRTTLPCNRLRSFTFAASSKLPLIVLSPTMACQTNGRPKTATRCLTNPLLFPETTELHNQATDTERALPRTCLEPHRSPRRDP